MVLKLGPPFFKELMYREVKALNKFNGQYACKCYFSNFEDGVRVLERLIPGQTLNYIKGKEERIKIFSKVAKGLNIKATEDMELPSYREILNRSINQINEEKFILLKDLMLEADKLYSEIEKKKLPKYLLHADLHHNNILITNDGVKAIDPHGFLGEKVLEFARFMENEIQKEAVNPDNIMNTINFMASCFHENKIMLCKVLFIDYTLSTCWDIEMNYSDEHIKNDCHNLSLILSILNNIPTDKNINSIKQLNLNDNYNR